VRKDGTVTDADAPDQTEQHPQQEGKTSPERLGLAPWLLDVLACPHDHAPLRVDEAAGELVCTGRDCGLAFPVRDGIPVLLLDEARTP
jgi:uncharacterized protein YbaR (Trm112 family)